MASLAGQQRGSAVADEFLQLVGWVEVVKRFEAGLNGVWVWLRLAHGASHPCGGTGAPVTRVPIQAGALKGSGCWAT